MIRRLLDRLTTWLSHPIGADAYVEYRVRVVDPTAWERQP